MPFFIQHGSNLTARSILNEKVFHYQSLEIQDQILHKYAFIYVLLYYYIISNTATINNNIIIRSMWISRCKSLEIFSTKKPIQWLLQIVEKKYWKLQKMLG